MSDPGDRPHERWSVNFPAIVGVVFVCLLAVVVWVVVSGGEGDETPPAAVPSTPTEVPETGAAGTTTPPPMPATTIAGATTTSTTSTSVPDSTSTTTSTTTAPTSTTTSTTASTTTSTPGPSTTVAVTAAPEAEPDAVAGDLGITGHPMSQPGCDGSYITIVASAIGDQASAAGIATVLDTYPGTDYLRTDQTCPSLNPAVDGQPIYVVYLGPFAGATDACAARGDGPADAYVRQLSDDLDPDHGVDCSDPA